MATATSGMDVPTRAGAEPATFGARAGASLLDTLVLAVGYGVAFVLLGISDATAIVGVVIIFAMVLLYAPLMLAFAGGQTLGRMVANVRVVNNDGTPIGLGRALLRESVVKLIFGFLTIPWLVSVLWVLRAPEHRALHDLVVDTKVVRT